MRRKEREKEKRLLNHAGVLMDTSSRHKHKKRLPGQSSRNFLKIVLRIADRSAAVVPPQIIEGYIYIPGRQCKDAQVSVRLPVTTHKNGDGK